MPLLRAFGECKSAITAVERLTFPLLIPPMILERRKMPKDLEAAHSAYDAIKPICRRKKGFFIRGRKVFLISDHFAAKHLIFFFHSSTAAPKTVQQKCLNILILCYVLNSEINKKKKSRTKSIRISYKWSSETTNKIKSVRKAQREINQLWALNHFCTSCSICFQQNFEFKIGIHTSSPLIP